jgi:outer membrane protein
MALKQLEIARSGYYPSVSFFASWNSRYMDREKIVGARINPDRPYRIIGITEQSHENVLAPNLQYVTGPPDSYFTQLADNQGTAFGFNVNIPLFNRFRVRRQVEKAALEVEKASLAEQTEKRDTENNIRKLYADVLHAREKMKAALKNKEAAETAFEYASEKLEAGLISPYDLENSKSRKISAETQYISAKYEYMLKLKLLEITLKGGR